MQKAFEILKDTQYCPKCGALLLFDGDDKYCLSGHRFAYRVDIISRFLNRKLLVADLRFIDWVQSDMVEKENKVLSDEEKKQRHNEKARIWYRANREKAMASSKKWAKENRDIINARQRKYRNDNIEYYQEYDRKRYMEKKRLDKLGEVVVI